MKVRLRNNSLRVRLTQSEVAVVAAGKAVEQTTRFTPASALIVRVAGDAQTRAPAAMFEDSRITLLLPATAVKRWAESDEVGISGTQAIGAGGTLAILVEKDFECLHSREQGIEDAFPNPQAG